MSREAYIAMKKSLPQYLKTSHKLAFIKAFDERVVEKAVLGMFGDIKSELGGIAIR